MLTQLEWRVAPVLKWQVEFGLWLRHTPTYKRRERSQLTLSAYEGDLAQLAQWFSALNNASFEPGQLNAMDLKTYFLVLEDKGAAPATYNRKLASVRMLIKWAREAGYLDYDPAEWIPFTDAVRQSPRDVSDEELKKLEAAAQTGEGTILGLRDSLSFFLMSDVGLRISEVLSLRLDDLKNLEKGSIHILGKGRKHRNPEVGGRVAGLIRRWISEMPGSLDGTLITDEDGWSIGREQAWKRFGIIAKRADVNTTPHAMRHTYIVRYIKNYLIRYPGEFGKAIIAACKQTGDTPDVILSYYNVPSRSEMHAVAEMM